MALSAWRLAEDKLFGKTDTWFSSSGIGSADFVTVVATAKGIDEFLFSGFENLAGGVVLLTLKSKIKYMLD